MSIEDRVKLIEDLLSAMSRSEIVDLSNDQMEDARTVTLYSLVQELAERAGISTAEFHRHYQIRCRWWHDYFLRKAENMDPSLAAELDTRAIDECDVSGNYPPLFGPPPP
jgi:hypothetical protein